MLRQTEWPFGWGAHSPTSGRAESHLSSRKQTLIIPGSRCQHLGAILPELVPWKLENKEEVFKLGHRQGHHLQWEKTVCLVLGPVGLVESCTGGRARRLPWEHLAERGEHWGWQSLSPCPLPQKHS